MLRKMARSGRQTPFGPAEELMAVHTPRICLEERPEKRQHSLQFGSHPGNPGLKEPLARPVAATELANASFGKCSQ